jgi:hypothetical protein
MARNTRLQDVNRNRLTWLTYALFIQVPSKRILRSSYPASCICRPKPPSKAAIAGIICFGLCTATCRWIRLQVPECQRLVLPALFSRLMNKVGRRKGGTASDLRRLEEEAQQYFSPVSNVTIIISYQKRKTDEQA